VSTPYCDSRESRIRARFRAGREQPPGTGAAAGVVDSERSLDRPTPDLTLWITEHGELVAAGRVKKIRLAQDVVNSAEESVYDTLWTAKPLTDEREPFRIVQVGYDYLAKRTRLSKKTVQRIVAKLIDKDFAAIERPADIYGRTSTVYRVFSYKAVLERHQQRGRQYVAKIGPGFSYVRQIENPPWRQTTNIKRDPAACQTTVPARNMSTVDRFEPETVDRSRPDTVVKTHLSTMVKTNLSTVDKLDMPTVVNESTILGNLLGTKASSSSSRVYEALSQYGVVDDIVLRLINACKQTAADCTDDEIIHFIKQKGAMVRTREGRIYSPIGFLLTAVPKCFAGEAFRLYREMKAKRREHEAITEARKLAELAEWRKEQEARWQTLTSQKKTSNPSANGSARKIPHPPNTSLPAIPQSLPDPWTRFQNKYFWRYRRLHPYWSA
jgi:hypothetical protein